VFSQGSQSSEKKPEQAARMAPMEVTTDTQGVDFGPYLQEVLKNIKRNWYSIIPESAGYPLFKKGKVSIEFAIGKDGKIEGLRYDIGSGDLALDRAAYGGITASNPFPPLPHEFKGPYLGLRMTFSYNPDRDHNERVTEKLTSPNQNLIGLAPWHVQVPAGTSVQFAPILKGITDQTKFPISWSVVGDCGAATCGNISESGMYTAPRSVPLHPLIFVKAKADAVNESYLAVVTVVPADTSQTEVQHDGSTKREFPQPTGYVDDFANVLNTEAKKQLAALCAELEQKTNAQIAVVTVQTLEGASIEDYAVRLFNEWGIGHKEDNRGLLILLSMEEHKYRIEVGLGFEALFPNDRVAKIGAAMVPDLKQQRYSEALLRCTRTLASIAADEKHIQLYTLGR
jgi:TonB family protein